MAEQLQQSNRVKYEPKFGRVLIKREVNKKVGSIYIPEASQKRHARCEGVIVALGETAGWTVTYNKNGEEIRMQPLRVGQKVIFGNHSGAWLDSTETKGQENDDGTLFICQDIDILCAINE